MKLAAVISCHLALFASLHLHAQQITFTTYTMQDGLIANPVRRIFHDSKGFIWVATWEGLSKYEGHRFINFNSANGLSHPLVNDFYEKDGRLYVALNNGDIDIIEHDVITGRFNPGFVINNFLILKNKKVLVSTDINGVHEFEKGRFIKPVQDLPGSSGDRIIELNDSLLLCQTEAAVSIFDRRYRLLATREPSRQQIKNFIGFRCAYQDSQKRIWIGMDDGLKLLSFFSADHSSFANTPDLPAIFNIDILRKASITAIREGSNGDFWIATSRGLVRLRPDGFYYIFTKEDGLPSENITSIIEDREKNIWIGTVLGVVKIATVNNILIHSGKTGLNSEEVLDIVASDSQRLLISSVKGIQEYDMASRRFKTIALMHDDTAHYVFAPATNPVLLYNITEMARYDTEKQQVTDKKLLPSYPFCLLKDKQGNLILSSGEGLLIYPENLSPASVFQGFRTEALLLTRSGELWAGLWAEGLYKINYTVAKNKTQLSVKDFTKSINAKHIRSLFEDSRGNIWVGTRYNGAFCLSRKNDTAYNVINIGQQNGLISVWVKSFAEDKNGNIWVGTHLGINKLIPGNGTYRVFNFSQVNNFFGFIGRIVVSANNTIWVVADNKLVQVNDEQLENRKPEAVYITSVTSGTASQKKQVQPDSSITLKYSQNQLQFEFSAPSFINEKQVLYSYRLAGSHETQWSTPSNMHTVSYASLQPGKYRFEVRTLGWNMQWGEVAYFDFTIRPPFWATWWFVAICILLLSFLFYIFYRYRIHQFKKVQAIRNRIATDLHDDFGASLTNIGILSELSTKKLQEPHEAKIFLSRITEQVNVLGQSLDDIIWSVNSHHDTTQETFARMRRYAAELFDMSYTHCELQFDENTSHQKLNMEQRRDLYLIYKESLNNIHKHAQARHVWVKAGIHHSHFEMTIKDDGRGFQKDMPSHRNGLKNIQARVKKWNGDIIIESGVGKGTCLHISLPVS